MEEEDSGAHLHGHHIHVLAGRPRLRVAAVRARGDAVRGIDERQVEVHPGHPHTRRRHDSSSLCQLRRLSTRASPAEGDGVDLQVGDVPVVGERFLEALENIRQNPARRVAPDEQVLVWSMQERDPAAQGAVLRDAMGVGPCLCTIRVPRRDVSHVLGQGVRPSAVIAHHGILPPVSAKPGLQRLGERAVHVIEFGMLET
mmetsp:Transcript_65426/g.165806  ORF Transcript_65426/g.165806 Transcript_65426/m.165806 type:complete len:200 (+) Transcript_65426:168-767(+)